jgi:hypothetical protein
MKMHTEAAVRILESRSGNSLRGSPGIFSWRVNGVVLAVALLLAGCSGAGEQASKMTSFSTAESQESKAELFSLPADQMSHIQIVTVGQGPLARILRLTGAVEYAGNHAGGWAGQPGRSCAG